MRSSVKLESSQAAMRRASIGSAAIGWAALFVTLAALWALAGCGAAPGPVALSDAWPEKPGEYQKVHDEWTRRAVIQKFDEQILEVFATFKSPAWRAAHVAQNAKLQRLGAEGERALAAKESEAAAESHELHLLVTTWDSEENDLHEGERSVWTLSLRDDRGSLVEPTSIERDKRPLQVIRAEYPNMGDFATAYVVRFPRTLDILRQGAKQFSLTMASPRGSVELVWQGR